jgi:ceramide glucosyltransferase
VDDYEVGHRVAQRGYRVVFAPSPVSMIYPRETLAQFLRHELRWTIGLRNVRPLGHAAVGLILGFPWTLLALLAAPTATIAFFYLFAYLAFRYAVYLAIGAWGLRDAVVRRNWWLAPVRDLAVFGVWIASFFSNRISWRGLEFRVEKGLLIPVRNSVPVSLLSPNGARERVADSFEAAPMLMESLIEVGPRSSSSGDLRFSNEPSCVE